MYRYIYQVKPNHCAINVKSLHAHHNCVCVCPRRSLLWLRFMGRAPPHLWRNNKINMLTFI